jgi:crotonobetainyl-CoA:carnitine CoA-transferase CaiB-like acyl-CoA transferase
MQNVIPRLQRTPGRISHVGPDLGAHNRDVYLGELGMTEAELESLHGAGVV